MDIFDFAMTMELDGKAERVLLRDVAHAPLVRWIRRQAGCVRRLASVCTGAFFLAEAGLLQRRQDNAAIKVRYNARTRQIRIMAPLPEHGNCSDVLSDLVKVLLRHFGQDWQSFDPITLKRFGEAGLEPDACFFIRNREAFLGKKRIDLASDPPADLALEVDAASPSNFFLTNPTALRRAFERRAGYRVPDGVIRPGVAIGRIEQVILTIMLPQRGRLDRVCTQFLQARR